MLWYGKSRQLNFKTIYKRKKSNYNLRTRKLAFSSPKRHSLAIYRSKFYIPSNWQVVILKQPKVSSNQLFIYFYNEVYYFKLSLADQLNSWRFDPYARTLAYKNPYLSSFYRYYKALIKQVITSFATSFFRKLKIKGKGYYIYKNIRNTVTHQFGHSHRTYIYTYYTTVKFLSKTTVLLFGSSKADVFSAGLKIRSSKYINIFTGRGVRFSKQIVYKKTGKVSAYR